MRNSQSNRASQPTGNICGVGWILKRSFYARGTVEVARSLLGKHVVRVDQKALRSGVIVETEAYLGEDDKGSHASHAKSRRARIMFGPPGIAYVYITYGMYYCLNVVTEPDGKAGAVLIRAVVPAEGIELMWSRRRAAKREFELANGPGKLCQALDIDKRMNGRDMCALPLFIVDRGTKPERICSSPRIGIDYAGEWAKKHLRFFDPESAYVSRHKA